MALFKNRPLIIAHRGASAYFPENTLSSFEAALGMHADMIEFDVQITKDQIPVIFHDTKLESKTKKRGLITDYSLDEMKVVDDGSWVHTDFSQERIPTLDETLGMLAGKILLNIEIKTEAVSSDPKAIIEHAIIDLVKKYSIEDQVLISSFDYRALERIKAIAPSIHTAVLYDKKQAMKRNPLELVKDYKASAFNCSSTELSKKWVDMLNKENIPFYVYTVNQKRKMHSLITKGAAGLFSDKPDLLKKVVDRLHS